MNKKNYHVLVHTISGIIIIFLLSVIFFKNNSNNSHDNSDSTSNEVSSQSTVTDIEDLKFQNNILKDSTTELVKRMHTIAEDLFNPCYPIGGLNYGVKEINNTNKLKISNLKIRNHKEQSLPDWVRNYQEKDYIIGFIKIENYDEICDNNLTSNMKSELENMRTIFEYVDSEHPDYNGLYVADGGKGCLNYYISSEFISKSILKDKIEYTVVSKYGDDKIITCEKEFVLSKENNKWLIDKFESSQFYFPEEQ